MEARLQTEQQELIELEQLHQQKLDEYQQRLDNLKFQEQRNKESKLFELEEQVQEWLGNDIERLTHKAMKKLKILPPTDTGELNALQNEPIRVLIGVTERTKTFESVIVESDNYLNLEVNKNSEIYIDAKDFESEPSYDGKNRKYGVYGFLVIFLCGNFLAYYKCYLNFIRGKTVDDETCEYFYDSIVSVKIQEKFSVRGKNENQKNISIKRLIITAKDGKAVCFEIARNRIEKTHSLRLSQIDEAAIAIRYMLRQRRVDSTQTQNLDEGLA
jgi:small nuclear ribonucleoprotein (snRNP)-like protein